MEKVSTTLTSSTVILDYKTLTIIEHLIGMAMKNELSWNTLSANLEEMATTLQKSNQVIKILLRILQSNSSKSKDHDFLQEEQYEQTPKNSIKLIVDKPDKPTESNPRTAKKRISKYVRPEIIELPIKTISDIHDSDFKIKSVPLQPSKSQLKVSPGQENVNLDNYNSIHSQFDESYIKKLNLDDKHSFKDVEEVVMSRLQNLGYEISPTQPETPKDGNCWIHGIIDQLR